MSLKDVTNTCKRLRTNQTFGGISVVQWKKLKTSKVIVNSNRNRAALVRVLLSNNSLFVGQLYKDKSLKMFARDLISKQ